MKTGWQKLDETIRSWWDDDLKTAHEEDIRNDEAKTLLYLPFPYSSAAGSERAFPEMYGWDTHFINLGLLAHGRLENVRWHILNQLSMIERYGMVLNGNRTYYLTRAQPPLLPDSIWRYFLATKKRAQKPETTQEQKLAQKLEKEPEQNPEQEQEIKQPHPDLDLLFTAYPLLKKEYTHYWNGEHHSTPTGLATNRDLGDPNLRAELAAEAETGLDFNALFGGDVRNCVPLQTNCILVQYARVLANIADALNRPDEARAWKAEADRRALKIRALCWNEDEGFFFEYDTVRGEQLPVWSLCAYWTIWAGVATYKQADRLVGQLERFEAAHGLTFTDKAYSSPHPEFQHLQWSYPAGWPPMHIMVVQALQKYNYEAAAQRIAEKYLRLMLELYEQTGKLWEKYNVVEGTTEIPVERAENVPFHGWTSSAAVLFGQLIFERA